MAFNLTHVRAAYEKLKDVADSARAAIEDKQNVTEKDDDRISAYEEFLNTIEEAFDTLEGELQA